MSDDIELIAVGDLRSVAEEGGREIVSIKIPALCPTLASSTVCRCRTEKHALGIRQKAQPNAPVAS